MTNILTNGEIGGILHYNRLAGNFGIGYLGLNSDSDLTTKRSLDTCEKVNPEPNFWPELPTKKMSEMERILDETTIWRNPDFSNPEQIEYNLE